MDTTTREIDQTFAQVFEALDLKEQRKALRSAMRREANSVRKTVIGKMQGGGLGRGTRQPLAKSLYARVYPDKFGAGFMVSVMPHGNKGIHTNRQRMKKPVLMFAEEGTRPRRVGKRRKAVSYTSRLTGKRQRGYMRSGHRTGSMPAYHFMRDAEQQATQSVEQNLFRDFQDNLNRELRKKGLL